MKTLNLKQTKAKYKAAKRWSESQQHTEKKGDTNCCECSECGHVDKYLYLDSGVTPFKVLCSKCNAPSHRKLGEDINPALEPTHEWYRPSLNHVMVMQKRYPMIFDHIINGGLMPREISK